MLREFVIAVGARLLLSALGIQQHGRHRRWVGAFKE